MMNDDDENVVIASIRNKGLVARINAGRDGARSCGDHIMKNDSLSTLQLILTREKGVGRVTVPLKDFLVFDLWITHKLEQLVDRWSDQAAPRAARSDGLFVHHLGNRSA